MYFIILVFSQTRNTVEFHFPHQAGAQENDIVPIRYEPDKGISLPVRQLVEGRRS
jgi:hypothetical protein